MSYPQTLWDTETQDVLSLDPRCHISSPLELPRPKIPQPTDDSGQHINSLDTLGHQDPGCPISGPLSATKTSMSSVQPSWATKTKMSHLWTPWAIKTKMSYLWTSFGYQDQDGLYPAILGHQNKDVPSLDHLGH
ncbi:hypothetical protein AV530_009602 [Patagioenas fasciata monilis]|uniref:Uncharacterized protein n=1 Tax=Patagioenas fasciata monilis TaxID=372326 RepID=A0A1V4KN92_PATFA|nr:hypothetical protein AV530_009602 [Patagioenas fasciata monilis]